MIISLKGQTILTLSSGLYLSYLPDRLLKNKRFTGAGLIGSLWGVVLLAWFPLDPMRQLSVWAGVLAVSVAVSDAAETLMGRHDDPRLVIDEVIGFLTAMLFLPRSWPAILGAFVFFRLFDVWKPGWIRRAAGLPGGWGIVMDDVLAGACANVMVRTVQFFYPI